MPAGSRPIPDAERIDAQAELKIHLSNFRQLNDIISGLQGVLNEAYIEKYGVALSVTGGSIFTNECQVMDAGSGHIFIKRGIAIDTELRIIRIPSDTDAYAIPTVNTIYNVILKYATTRNEVGTIGVTTSSFVIDGTDTEFESVFKSPGGDLIRISGSALGNDGDYIVDSVSDDGELTLAATDIDGVAVSFTTETGLNYQYLGDYDQVHGGTPPSQPLIYVHDYYEIVIRLASSGYTVGTEMLLATVSKNAAGTVTITDRRYNNVLRLRHITDVELGEASGPVVPALVRVETGATSIEIDSSGLAPTFPRC
jgi:hypothetical protein